MATMNDVVQRLDTLNNVVQASQNGWGPDGFIKVFDHIIGKVGDILPEPTFAKASKEFALKISGAVSGITFLLGVIGSIILYVKLNNTSKSKLQVREYDSEGNVIEESSSQIKYTEDDGCKNEYKDGKISKTSCVTNKTSSIWVIVLICTIVLSIVAFVMLYGPLKKWHYDKAIRFSNPYHKTFIDYAHRLFMPEE